MVIVAVVITIVIFVWNSSICLFFLQLDVPSVVLRVATIHKQYPVSTTHFRAACIPLWQSQIFEATHENPNNVPPTVHPLLQDLQHQSAAREQLKQQMNSPGLARGNIFERESSICCRWQFVKDYANLFDTILVLGGLVDTRPRQISCTQLKSHVPGHELKMSRGGQQVLAESTVSCWPAFFKGLSRISFDDVVQTARACSSCDPDKAYQFVASPTVMMFL